MKKRRKVFLFGAGAALAWYNAPSTQQITEIICKTGFKNAKGEFVTKKIFQWLQKEGYEPNFETIFSVIEDFLRYWKRSKEAWNNGVFYFVDSQNSNWKDFIDLKKYQILKESSGGNYSIHIPDRHFNRVNANRKTMHPNAKYFELLLTDIHKVLNSLISKYSFFTVVNDGFYKKEENRRINSLFQSYIRCESEDSCLRMYTLNYDVVFQVLFEKENIPIIQGFDTKERNVICRLEHGGAKPDPYEVIHDRESHCIYHLHGNIYWSVNRKHHLDIRKTSDKYEYQLLGYPDFNNNSSSSDVEMEQGNKLFLSNIITGYQKLQRTALSPFRQMMSSFDQDCYEADELFIIGYSFGDEHINDIVRQAKKVNKSLKIKIVNPGYNDELNLKLYIDWNQKIEDFKKTKLSEDHWQYPNMGVEVYKMKFEEFLERMKNNDR